MVDIEKQIAYWRNGASEDWTVAQELIQKGRTRHGLFFAHLALEKALKAHVCRQTRDLAPRTHNLVRLAELAAVPTSVEQMRILAEMNAFNVEGRCPDLLSPPPNPIDLIVVSPLFDGERKRQDIDLLWRMTVTTDSRIEPIAVGERQWLEDDASAIVEIARREGQVVPLT